MSESQSPNLIWKTLGITDPEQADIELVAYFYGAVVEYRKLDGCAARIIGLGNKAIITVDERHSEERQRFSIGHELGHWIKDKGKRIIQCKKDVLSPKHFRNFDTDPEARANQFAVDLLMPQFLFREAVKNKPITMFTAREMQSLFRVSLTAATIRLVELGAYPCFVICHDASGYLWSWRSDLLPFSIRVRRVLSKDTSAYKLISNRMNCEEGIIDVDADDWVEHELASDYVVKEDSVRIDNNKVLSLIWFKDESLLSEVSVY